MKWLLIILIVFVAFPANAAEVATPAICLLTSEYHPSDDVNYQPGVDVHGNPVTQADLGMMPFDQADIVSVPLTVDLARRIRETPDEYEGVEMQAPLGMLDIQMDGTITFNGQDWTGEVRRFCGDPTQWPDGQAAADVIQSEPEEAAAPEQVTAPAEPKPPVQKVVEPAPAPEPAAEPKVEPVAAPQSAKEEEEPGRLLEGGESREEGYR